MTNEKLPVGEPMERPDNDLELPFKVDYGCGCGTEYQLDVRPGTEFKFKCGSCGRSERIYIAGDLRLSRV